MILESQDPYGALKQCRPCVENKSVLPILSHILLVADGPMVKIRATNLDMAVEIHVKAETEPGEIYCLPYRTLTETVQTFSGYCEITAAEDNGYRVRISNQGDYASILLGSDPSDYPVWSEFPDLNGYPVSRSEFLASCQSVIHAASKDDHRFGINSIRFDGEAKRLIATDGHRVKYQAANWLCPGDALVPTKTMQAAIKALKLSQDTDLIVAISEKNVHVNGPNTRLTLRLMEAEPFKDFGFTLGDLPVVTMPRKQVEKALRLTRIMLNTRKPWLRLHFRPFRVQFLTTDHDGGHARTEIEGLVPPELQGLEIDVNWLYFSQAIKAAPAVVPLSVAGNFITLANEFICRIKPDKAA